VKIALKELKPNPFKRMINKGKLNEIQIEEISGNLDELGFMGAIPVVKIKNNYHLVNSHHRIEALKRKFGKNYEVPITIHNYNEDQLIRGMVIENLAQRGSDFKEELENIRTVEEYLNSNNDKLTSLRDSRSHMEKLKNEFKNGATAMDIQQWLKLSEKKWSHDTIREIMNIYNKLSPDLLSKVNYVRGGQRDDPSHLSVEDARNLSRIENKEEQKKIRVILEDTGLDHKKKSRLITSYKSADEETKKKVINKQIDIRDIEYEINKLGYIKERNLDVIQKQSPNEWIIEISDSIKKTGELLDPIKLDWCKKTQLELLYRYIKVDFDEHYKPFLKKLLEKIQEEEVKRLK